MKLEWIYGQGPSTTQELADLIEAEGRLITGSWCSDSGRCLWGAIEDYSIGLPTSRILSSKSVEALRMAGLRIRDNDGFVGTPKERCVEMARRCRAIP